MKNVVRVRGIGGAAQGSDEITADYAGEMIEDQDLLKQFIQKNKENKNVLRRFLEAVKQLASKLTGKYQKQAKDAVALLEKAVGDASRQASKLQASKNTAGKGGERYDIKGKDFQEDKYFARQMDRWDDLANGSRIKVGVVQEDSALNRVGLPATGMYFDVGKIKKAMGDHSDHLTPDVLKGIPDLLNDPIVIAEYTGPNGDVKNTVNVYGNLFVGKIPVVVGVVMRLDSNGKTVINNIRTVHARSNFAKQITDESVLYLNEDKKRTRKWFHDCGNLNVPLAGTRFGLIRSIAFDGGTVNGKFSLKGSDDYQSLVEKYGAIEQGENQRARDVQVPRQTADGKKVSRTVRTVMEASATSRKSMTICWGSRNMPSSFLTGQTSPSTGWPPSASRCLWGQNTSRPWMTWKG